MAVKMSNMYFIEVIELLRQTPGKLDKEAIVKEAIETNPGFADYLRATYNVFVQYGIKKIPAYVAYPSEAAPLTIRQLLNTNKLDILSNRVKTGAAAIEYLKNLLESLNEQDAKALELLIARDLSCGVSDGTINKARKGLIPTYPVMLCEAYDDKLANKFKFPAMSQIKNDGLRANVIVSHGKVSTRARSGLPLYLDDVFAELGSQLPGIEIVIDGEVLVADDDGGFLPRKISNGIINKITKGTASADEISKVRFVAWDLIPLNAFETGKHQVGYQTRLADLTAIINGLSGAVAERIIICEGHIVHNLHEAKAHFTRATERKLEGTILKTLDGAWVDGRPNYQLKMKLELECDLLVLDMIEGEGKYVGKLGAFVCGSADGLLVSNVGTGITDKQREELWAIREQLKGKAIIAVKYNERIQSADGSWSLFLPVFIEVRMDKTVADRLDQIK